MKKVIKKGFTLTELLISLGIIGLISVLVVPPLMNDVFTKVYINQLKNMTTMIEQLAADQMINKKVTNLSDTDFNNKSKLLSTDHFAIVANQSLSGVSYKKSDGTAATVSQKSYGARLLKNGAVLGYAVSSSTSNYAGVFILDVNGTDSPNIVGRDLFVFKITKKGKIVSGLSTSDNTLSNCQNGNAQACYGYLSTNNWKY